jgi:hypothetical protein
MDRLGKRKAGWPPNRIGLPLRPGKVGVLSRFLLVILEHSVPALIGHREGHRAESAAAIPGMRNEKGRSHDLPFSLNKFCFRAVIAVRQRCCIRLFGRFLPKLRPPSWAAFFCIIPGACQLLIVPTFPYLVFVILPGLWAFFAPFGCAVGPDRTAIILWRVSMGAFRGPGGESVGLLHREGTMAGLARSIRTTA